MRQLNGANVAIKEKSAALPSYLRIRPAKRSVCLAAGSSSQMAMANLHGEGLAKAAAGSKALLHGSSGTPDLKCQAFSSMLTLSPGCCDHFWLAETA